MADFSDKFLDDTHIPNVFISDYLSDLGFLALKLYIMSSMKTNSDGFVEGKDVGSALGYSKEDFQAAILELSSHGLVEANNDLSQFKLLNLKKKAIDQYYRRKTNKPISKSVENTTSSDTRQSLINSINNTYFQGMMGPAWYQAIDSWFEDYRFDESVVYHMVMDAAERNKLNGPNYLSAVAKDYASNNIKTYDDLVRYKENNKKVTIIANQVGKALNKRMSSYDFRIVEKWVNEFNYDFDIIEVSLRAAVRLSEPNLNYFDKILQSWHEAGIKTSEEAENVIANNKKSRNNIRRAASSNPKIDERNYDDEFLSQFYEFDFLDDEEQGNG